MPPFMRAYEKNRVSAEQALALFRSFCELPLGRVPGVDTVIRLAWRLEHGRTIEQAAAREYLYRWELAIKTPDQCMLPHNSCVHPTVSIFGAPATIGM